MFAWVNKRQKIIKAVSLITSIDISDNICYEIVDGWGVIYDEFDLCLDNEKIFNIDDITGEITEYFE